MQVSLSIITVCFNSEGTIKDTLNSVLQQGCTGLEYIVIDGKSTDNTTSILSGYEQRFNHKNISFRWISERDEGLYDAMNKGIEISKKDWIWFINADDYLEKDAVSSVFLNSQNNLNEYHGIYGKVTRVGEVVTYVVGRRNLVSKKKQINFNHSSTIVKRSVFSQFGNFNTNFKYCADYDLFTRFVLNGVRFIYIDENLSYMRDGGISDKIHNYIKRGFEHFVIDKDFNGITIAAIRVIRFFSIDLIKKIFKSLLIKARIPFLLKAFYKGKYESVEIVN